MQIHGYFINLDSATARCDYMEAEIARLGLPITRLAAVNGASLSDSDYSRLHPFGLQFTLSRAEVACFLSHRACWTLIAHGATPFGAVFEDDIAFADDTASFLGQDDWLPADTELVKLETMLKWVKLSSQAIAAKSRALAKLSSCHLGAAGYIVSKALAHRLLAASETFTVPVDHAVFDPTAALFPEVCVWQLTPAICVQQNRSSEVFLPSGTAWSDLDAHRKVRKRHGLAKLKRELVRPFLQLHEVVRGSLRAEQTDQKRTIVRFLK
ncbi:MAG: glycosyltransferase family 25 protein [Rhodobacteraceae bacterium]|nr:glycosyltransferase family 25 protein [Paracoccaceae bacterium]